MMSHFHYGFSGKHVTIIRFVTILSIVTIALAACGAGPATKDISAASLLPNLDDYGTADTADIQDAITKLAGAASLSTGQVEVTALIAGVNSIVGCYQKAGAISGKAYVNKTDPLKAGVIVIANRNLLTDPSLFLSCVVPSSLRAQSAASQPCGKTYTLDTGTNQFYIGYAATNAEVCATFCNALQACTSQ
jgi:hypothetical protein